MRIISMEGLGSTLSTLEGREPRIVVSGNFGSPLRLLEALHDSLERCRLFALNAQPNWPSHAGYVCESPFVGPGMRGDPGLDYLPMRLSLVPRLFASTRPVDAVLLHTSVPRNGKVSLGIEVNILPAAVEQTRRRGGVVVAQLNPRMPYTFGDGELSTDLIDLAVEVDEPLMTPTYVPPDEVALEIGAQVSRFVRDGATIQLGIGQIPTVAAGAISVRRRLGVWSEMLSDGILDLERAGSLDPDRAIQASFMIGSAELYEWSNENERIRLTRTEVINDPARIAANPGMTSINTAMQVDLFAQANASFVRDRIYSGFGGQPDFVTGALHSTDGHAVVALRSWHDKSDTSTVVPLLTNPATSFQHTAIVSEHGCAEIFGRSQRAQCRLLINSVADPRAREELTVAARAFGQTA